MKKKNETAAAATATTTLQTTPARSSELPPMFVEAEKLFERMAELSGRVASRAFDYFRMRGGEFGRELDDWFSAEREILRPTPVEISETDDEICVKAAVPGFKPTEIEVSVNGNLLIITGKALTEQTTENSNVILSEWRGSEFFRHFRLPSAVDADNVAAVLRNGVLELKLPKAAATEVTKIAVASA